MYEEIDLSFMRSGKVAVNCRTEDELVALVEAISERYPGCSRVYHTKLKQWKYDHDEDGMAIKAILLKDGSIDYGHCTARWYKQNGYNVIDMHDLYAVNDYGNFDPGYCDTGAAFAALF